MTDAAPLTFSLAPSGEIPNSRLPVLIYRASALTSPTVAERAFADRGWLAPWRDGIFAFHHFHSTAHEALAIVRGEVTVTLGGSDGETIEAGTGDVLVLPAGTGHRRESASSDLLVVGAYPNGLDWDVRRGDPAERELVATNLAAVPLPDTDPLHGPDGPLVSLWG